MRKREREIEEHVEDEFLPNRGGVGANLRACTGEPARRETPLRVTPERLEAQRTDVMERA